ncbi:DUF6077 domain-containing protein [Oryzobacter terrae]|uniref:DUF6077 domain-containing protein n=1 Tax=Oryzobacter terrae TaxID=1620385 RepID=UPI0036729371
MSRPPLAERLGRSVLTVALVGFATWTLLYQLALVVDLPATATLIATLVVTVLALLAGRRFAPGPDGVAGTPPAGPSTLLVLGATAVGTVLVVVDQRGAALTLLLVAAVVALVLAVRRDRAGARPEDASPAADDAGTHPLLWPVGWVGAVASGVLSMFLIRPDGDDAYFVNLSTWVAERGRFPLRDTMISPDTFPALGAHSPPVHSVEGLIGAVARVAGVEAGTVTYVLVPPVATLLAVLALTLLVDEARVPVAPAGLAAALGYLWLGGASGFSVGNFFAVRLWQGKAMLASIVLPLVLAAGIRLVRHGTVRTHLLLGAAVVASVGVSNTAVFIVPVLLGGMALGALALRRVRGAVRLAAWLPYPLAAGAASLVFAPRSPTVAERTAEGFDVSSGVTTRFDVLATVPGGHGGLLLASCLALGLGVLGIRDVTTRLCTLGAVVAGAVVLHPAVRDLLESAGLGAVAWRFWWVLPIPLLVAGATGALAGLVPRGRTVVAVTAAAALALLPLVDGKWTGSEANGTRVATTPFAWKTPRGSYTEARLVERVSEPGDTVLAPWDTSRVLVALTVDVQPVAARRFYLPAYAATPDAHAGVRDRLQVFADQLTPTTEAETTTLAADLELLSVDTACVPTVRGAAVALLQDTGFRVVDAVGSITCLRR